MSEQMNLPGASSGFNLTEERLDAIVERWNNASGPLKVHYGEWDGRDWMIADFGMGSETDAKIIVTTNNVKGSELDSSSETDAEFYIYAYKDIPDLVNEVRRLRKLVQELRHA